MKRPNLFIVGAPKCGTTAMHQYVSGHPEVCMSDPKEPNYFGSLLRSFPQNDEDYVEYCYSHCRDEPIVGEATPLYLACPEAATRLRAFNSAAKVVIMLRNPVDMMYSLHSEFLLGGAEKERTFETALELEQRRLAGEPARLESRPPFTRFAYRHMASFDKQVRRYLDVFPRDQVHFILLEDLRKDAASTYRRLLEFLGVDLGYQPEFLRVNANKGVKSRALQQLLIRPPEWLREAGRLVIPDDRVAHRIRHGMRLLNKRINSRPEERQPLAEPLRQSLLQEKEGEIVELSRLIERDLSHWLEPTGRGEQSPALGRAK